MTDKAKTNYYRVIYKDPAKDTVRTLKARTIRDSSLGPTFVELSEFIFDNSKLIVNPEEEELKEHYANVERLHLAIFNILTIEEIGPNSGGLKLSTERANVVVLPGPKGKEDS